MSGKHKEKNSGMDIPDYAIERMARCLLPMLQKNFLLLFLEQMHMIFGSSHGKEVIQRI